MNVESNLVAALAALACGVLTCQAAVSFPDVFGDHAIVQKAADTAIWGRAEPGEAVEVSLGATAAAAVAGADGWWFARLDTSALGDGPFELEVRAPSGSAASSDILVGETWLAGGQSNMEFKMDSFGCMAGFDEVRAACAGRPIRMFRLSNAGAAEPVPWDARGTWRVVSPTNIGDITAVGYTFIDAIQRAIGGAAGVIDISVSGTRCWAWLPRATTDAFPELKAERLSQEAAAANGEHVSRPVEFCWNNRFFPVSKLSCRGILWYQGEDDSYQPNGLTLYQKWFSRMAEDMRNALGDPNLPFLYCQLAGWGMPASTPDENPGPAQLREAQRRVRRSIPRSAMAVTLDQSEHEIHGRYKRPVGERLAALAIHWVYGRTDLVCESPDFLRAEFRASDVLLTFANGGSPLAAGPIRTEFTWNAQSNTTIRLERRSSPESRLEGFVLLGGDGQWRWADAEIVGPDTVRVWADGAESPAAVRYCWGHQGFGNLRNEAGFPASPFTASTSNPGVSADCDFANDWRVPTATSTPRPQETPP
jgi:sialate O-acetylesterase